MKRTTRSLVFIAMSCWMVALALAVPAFSRLTTDGGSEQANILRATVGLLEHSQFAHHRLDADLSDRFLDRYLDALDAEHVLFFQSDLNEFDRYRPNLADLTRLAGDVKPAHLIYARYLERLAQRASYATNLLNTATFDFDGHDRWQTDRRDAARPENLTAAQALWREQLRAQYLEERLAGQTAQDTAKTLTRRYDRVLQTMRKLGSDQILEIYLDALAQVYDPHSDYLGHEQLESFNISMNLSLCGVGATLMSDDGYCTIRDLVPGGPAARSGMLKAGDRIVAVAQGHQEAVDVVDMPLPQAVELIRGPKGTTVRLTIIPAGPDTSARKTFALVRDEIKLEDQRAKARIVDLPQTNAAPLRVGVIDLPSFYGQMEEGAQSSASADVAQLLAKLKQEQVRGLILDLRQNGGGSLEEAIKLTGLFIHRGPVVQTSGLDGSVEVDNDPDPGVAYDGPLVVLTSRFSASASEILAGALQDYGRALIVGDSSTFGKGTVQTLVPLAPLLDRARMVHAEDPGAVKITIRKFYRPDGASTQLRGVVPDLILPSTTDLESIGETEMPDPLPWDSVSAAPFRKLHEVKPVLALLRRESAARVAHDPAFRLLRQTLDMVNERIEAKSVSLNEAERRHDKEQADALEAELKQTTEALAAHAPPTYDITLQDVDTPGLPPARTLAPAKPSTTGAPDSSGESVSEPVDRLGPPGSDVVLSEAQHILADYIHALESPLVVTQR